MATGEQRINEILTKVGLEGGPAAIRAAQAYDAAVKDISISSQAVDKATLGLDGALKSLTRQYDAAGLAGTKYATDLDKIQRLEDQGRVSAEQAATLRAGASDKLAASLQRASAAAQATAPALDKMGKGAGDSAKAFGLTSYQVQNLTFQLNDLVTQVASGGGILRPLIQQGGQTFQILQQGPGGVGGAISGITASLGRLSVAGPAAIAAIAVGAGAAAKGFADLRKEVEASEKSVRLLTDSQTQANRVIASAATAVQGTELAAKDLYALRTQAEALARVDPTAFTQGVARIAASAGASREQMLPMIAAVTDLTSKLTITAGEAQKLAVQFPELGAALAAAFRVTPQGLLRLPKTLEVSTVRLEEFFAAAAKGAPKAGPSLQNLQDSFQKLFVEVDKASGASKVWNSLTSSVLSGAQSMIEKLTELISVTGKAGQALKAIGSVQPVSTAPIDTAGGIIPLPGTATERVPEPTTTDAGTSTPRSRTTYADMVANREKNLEEFAKQTAKNTETLDDTATSTANTARYASQTVSAVNNLGGRLSAFAGAFDPAAAGANTSALGPRGRSLGSFSAGTERGPYQNYVLWSLKQRALHGENLNDLLAGSAGASSSGPGSGMGKDWYAAGLDKTAAAVSDLGTSAEKATLNLGDLGSPIQTQIDALRQQQETALSRVYRPDPYAERNPDFFYNGEKIFKEGQDKVYDGLQAQIVKLEGLQSTLSQLLNVNNAFPSAVVAAMQAAGFGDIAAQIVAAFKSLPGAPPSATPSPTAVQSPTQSPGTTASPKSTVSPNWYTTGKPSFVGW